jgi:hypothetical protein
VDEEARDDGVECGSSEKLWSSTTVLAPVRGVLARRSLHVSVEGRSWALGDREAYDGCGDVRLPVALSGTSDCGSSGTSEKVPLGWTASRKVRRRDSDRGRWEADAGDGEESARVRRGADALWSAILAETSDGDLSVGAVGPAGPGPEGLASGFTPETLSSLDFANEERRAVGDDNADPWPSVTSSLQLGRLACAASLLVWSLKFPDHRPPGFSRDEAWLGARSSGSSRGGE